MSPGSEGGWSDVGNRSARSDRSFRSHRTAGSAGSGPTSHDGPQSLIWGTKVNVQDAQRGFERFFDGFRLDGAEPDAPPYYHAYLHQLHETQEAVLNLDCAHIRAFNPTLYKNLVNYPQEVRGVA